MLRRIVPRPRHAGRRRATIAAGRHATIAVAAAALAGCGSATALPPPAGPEASPPLERRPAGRVVAGGSIPPQAVAGSAEAIVDAGRKRAVVRPRERVLEVYDRATGTRLGRVPAGAGPTRVVPGEDGLAYVVDTAGDGLLVLETRGRLRILRRYPLLGAPYGVAFDGRHHRLWVSLTARNELVELATGSRPHRLDVFPTVRQPNTVAIDDGRVYVTGEADGVLQLLDGRRSR